MDRSLDRSIDRCHTISTAVDLRCVTAVLRRDRGTSGCATRTLQQYDSTADSNIVTDFLSKGSVVLERPIPYKKKTKKNEVYMTQGSPPGSA